MKKVSLTEFKNNFSNYIELVKKTKEEILLTDRNVPVVKIAWPQKIDSKGMDSTLQLLEKSGKLKRPKRKPDLKRLQANIISPEGNFSTSVLEAVLAERDESW